MQCRFKSCSKCGGDLVLEEADMRCMQCARYYYAQPSDVTGETYYFTSRAAPVVANDLEVSGSNGDGEGPVRRLMGPRRTRSLRSINSMIHAKNTGEERWWVRNKEIIEHLEKGLSVREVSDLVHRGQRHIRTVRERLADLQATA